MQTVHDNNAARRHDIYSHIHKALRAMMADAERVQTLSQSLDRLVADYRRSVPAHYALKRQAIQARLQSAAAELVLIGADLELGKEEP